MQNMTKELITAVCKECNILNYTINDDNSIDVIGDVFLNNMNFNSLPLKFNKVVGNFHCYQNVLTSLYGSPKEVTGLFDCDNNNLITLEFCPDVIGRDLCCSENKITSLEYCPTQMMGNLYAYDNQLTPHDVISFTHTSKNKIFSSYSKEELRRATIVKILN